MADYSKLITSEHADKPKFAGAVQALTQPLLDIQAATLGLPQEFDLDAAVGAQLDAVGLWVGLSRELLVPIANAFFSFDTPGLGWDEGVWKGPYESTAGISKLDDASYRVAIRAKILKNYWNGTNQEHIDILEHDLADLGVSLVPVDMYDMSINLHVLGTPSLMVLALIQRGYIVPKPTGVRINLIIGGVPDPGTTLFALDDASAGLDVGSFAP